MAGFGSVMFALGKRVESPGVEQQEKPASPELGSMLAKC